MRNTDADWEQYAQRDPYWAVVTADEFRRDNLNDATRAAFFSCGEGTIADAMYVLQAHHDAPKEFGMALDFGCGVGRLLIPLARRSKIAIGVDVSPSMLEECRKNATQFGVPNIDLCQSDDQLSRVQKYAGKVELLTSLLVLQHIPTSRGLQIIEGLLNLLSPTCFGVIQLVIGSQQLVPSDGAELAMEMNHYDLNVVFPIMQSKGIHQIYFQLADHDGSTGITIYFHRK